MIRYTQRAMMLLLALSLARTACAQATQPGRIDIASATWVVANQPDVDVTAQVAGMVKDGHLDLRVSATTFGLPSPGTGRIGNLNLSYRINGGEIETRTARGGNRQFHLDAPPLPTGAAAKDDAPRGPAPILQLTAQDPIEASGGSTAGSLLVREIQRQAIALAAREELGLRTRDVVLYDTLAADEPGKTTTLLIRTQFWRAWGSDVAIALPDGTPQTDWRAFPQLDVADYVKKSPAKLVATVHAGLTKDPWFDYAKIVKDAEVEARGTFIQAIKKSGGLGTATPHPSRWVDHASIPDDAEKALQQMDPVTQFLAVRLLHAEIAAKGESPELIEALVRGYANLAFLLRPADGGAYKTYMARSLLYAERLVVHAKSDARALFVRAYARGMAGLGRLALEDLKAAKTAGNGAMPEWAQCIDPWCHYDLKAMAGLAAHPGPAHDLAQMLAVAIADDGYTNDKLVELGTACLAQQPGNVWVMQTLLHTEQLGIVGAMPEGILAALPMLLQQNASLLKLPPDLDAQRQNLKPEDDLSSLTRFRQALDAYAQSGADTGEPSLSALAGMLRDETFSGAYNQIRFLKYNLGVSQDEVATYARQTLPAWKDHPLAGFLQAQAAGTNDHALFRKLLDQAHPVDAGTFMVDEYRWRLPGQDYVDKWPDILRAEGHQDLLPLDITAASAANNRIDHDAFIQALHEESPYAAMPEILWLPLTYAKVDTQDEVEQAITQILKDFGDRPQVVDYLANWALRNFDRRRATQLAESLYKASPSLETARNLAGVYELTGDLAKARKLVDAAVPGAGLEYAEMCEDYALSLKHRFRYDEALPYDQIAAGTGASWGFNDLASCQQGLGSYDQVARLLQSEIERYEDNPIQYYAWAKRMGRPEVAQAGAELKDYLARHPDDYTTPVRQAIVDGNPAPALTILKRHSKDLKGAFAYLNYAVVAQEAGNKDEMASALKKAVEDTDESSAKKAATAFLAIASGMGVSAALQAYDVAIGPVITTTDDTPLLVGRFLVASGHKAEALHYLKMVLVEDGPASMDCSIACGILQRIGSDPVKLIAQMRDHPASTKELLGTWKVDQAATPAQWTFNDDGTMLADKGTRGQWWEWDGKVLVSWLGGNWAIIPWPASGDRITGDCPDGPNKLILQRLATPSP